jgi:hydrogenase maturation protease
MPRVLIVAYGNVLRGDDGVAWRAADQLEEKLSGLDVELLRRHQLVPELAESVSRAELVIFVDAASSAGRNRQPGELHCEEIDLPPDQSQSRRSQPGQPRFSHQFSTATVLTLARELYGASPRAFSLTVTGDCFDHGESLSAMVADSIPALIVRIEALVQQFRSPAIQDSARGKPRIF